MRTAKGTSYSTLLNVKIEQGTLYSALNVPMSIGDIDQTTIATMIPMINQRITEEKKPHATFERCLEQIELHRRLLMDAYVTLFETYRNMTTPSTRTSPIDKARVAMLQNMPDKLLRANAELYIKDKANDFMLPAEREQLIDAVVVAMREVK